MRGALLICRKEFLELSRDKRTLFFTFCLPVLLYPLIFAMLAGLGRQDAVRREARASRVAILDPGGVLEPGLRAQAGLFELQPVPSDPMQALKAHALDLLVEVEPGAAGKAAAMEPFEVSVRLDRSEPGGTLALERLRTRLGELDRERVAARLADLHAPPGLARPSRLVSEDIAAPGQEAGKLFGTFLPYLLMLMMFQGAMQHGIYVTAGEKERGTLQSLLATALPRRQIILGKLLYIFSMGLLAALLNLGSMGLSLGLALRGGGTAPVGQLAAVVDPVTLLLSFLLLVPLGFFFASFILVMGIRARNTAEAGTSLMPGLLLILVLGAVSLSPGLERVAWLRFVPVLNVSLAIRNLFGHQGSAFAWAVAFAMTVALAALMSWSAARALDRESVLFR